MTEPNFPISWLKLTKEQMDQLRAKPISSNAQMLTQIEMFTGYPIVRRDGNYYVQLPNGKNPWVSTYDQQKIEQVFSEEEMHVNLDDLRAMVEGHYGKTKEEIEELTQERERQLLREQLRSAQEAS